MELLKDLPETGDKYANIWSALERRFGYMNEPDRAMQHFDDRRQIEEETLAVYEQALRTLQREAWPSADAASSDGALKRRFIAGLSNPEMQQFLRLHAKGDDFAATAARHVSISMLLSRLRSKSLTYAWHPHMSHSRKFNQC